MTTTSPQATSPATLQLIDHAHAEGIRVWWRHTGRCGTWSERHRCIWLDPALTDREARSVLAHELGHAHYGDRGPQPPHIEARAWRWAADLLITRAEYALAEHIHGQDTAAIADALDVTLEVVDAYQTTLRRTA